MHSLLVLSLFSGGFSRLRWPWVILSANVSDSTHSVIVVSLVQEVRPTKGGEHRSPLKSKTAWSHWSVAWGRRYIYITFCPMSLWSTASPQYKKNSVVCLSQTFVPTEYVLSGEQPGGPRGRVGGRSPQLQKQNPAHLMFCVSSHQSSVCPCWNNLAW